MFTITSLRRSTNASNSQNTCASGGAALPPVAQFFSVDQSGASRIRTKAPVKLFQLFSEVFRTLA